MMKWHFGQKWGDLMSRRRSKNPTTAISITVPRSILDQIDDELTRTQSRSAWIAGACRDKLDGNASVSLESAPNVQLLTILVNRGAISMELYKIVKATKSFTS